MFPECEEITTIDWDCLKSVTFDSNKKEIDIKIPDSAVTKVVKVTKMKAKKTSAETIDNSEFDTKHTDMPPKKCQKRRNSGSDATPKSSVSLTTLNSIHRLLGAKLMQAHNHLSSLETAFPVENQSCAVKHADK